MADNRVDYCAMCGFDSNKIKDWLAWLNLDEQDCILARILHEEVILPNLSHIFEQFYARISRHSAFVAEFKKYNPGQFRQLQTESLLTIGQDFATCTYFDDRLRLGLFMAAQGAPLRLYPAASCLMQQILLDHIPTRIRENPGSHDQLIKFILKIMALNLSLSLEAAQLARMEDLQEIIRSLRSETSVWLHKAKTDALTLLPNHGEIIASLQYWIGVAHKEQTSLGLIMADIDFFKQVNDTQGHLAGDEVLKHVAARIVSAVREGDIAGRYGGEEFLIILPGADIAIAKSIAERIRCTVADRPINVGDQAIPVTISLGLTTYAGEREFNNFIARADKAMYRAKQAGRNRVMVEAT